MIITRTPVRIPIGGGGTDIPFYYEKFGGSLITSTITKYIYVTVDKRFEDEIRVSYSKTEIRKHASEIQHPIVRETLKLLNINEGIEITTIAEVPAGTGMGSSSSFTVGLLNALHMYKREHVSAKQLAEEACKIEIELLKEPIGKQDQYAAAFGGVINLDINKQGKILVSPLNLSQDTIEELEKNLFMFFTGFKRESREVLGQQKKAAEENDDALFNYYHEIKKIGQEIRKVLEQGNTRRFGEWLNIHWETKKNLKGGVSNPQIDSWYDVAMKNGALGGKLMGAGGGGFLLFYCDTDQKNFRETMRREGLKEVPFKFELDGSKVIFNAR